jgi:hypothetical protein
LSHIQRSLFVVIEVETTGHRCQPQLPQRLLSTEDQLGAVLELDGEHTGRAFQIDIQVAVVKDVFQRLLGGIDQVMETRFGQTHWQPQKCLVRLKRRKIRPRPPDCKE